MPISRRQFIGSLLTTAAAGLAAGCSNGTTVGELPPVKERPPVPVEVDLVLAGGTIVDGTGAPPYTGDVGIKDGRIVALGSFLSEGGPVIDVSGLVVTPGFIDLHTHTEAYMKRSGAAPMVLLQGVTSQIGGNCGTSVPSVGEYFASLSETGVNFGMFAGYRQLRRKVLGGDIARQATPAEVYQMQEELHRELLAGAFGLSVGLSYWPQSFATTDELVELSKVLKERGAFYSTHIRDEQDDVIPSLAEAIEIGQRSGAAVQYSHVKTAQRQNWGKMQRVVAMLEEAKNSGLDITGDTYAYTFSSLDLGTSRYSMSDEDMRRAISHPLIMVGSDSGLNLDGSANHPRAYGNYPRVLGMLVREEGLFDLPTAIHKMTAMPAKRLGLKDRGLLQRGYKADIAVFDMHEITDLSTRSKPSILPAGMYYVLVNGQLAVAAGQPTGVKAGEQLKLG